MAFLAELLKEAVEFICLVGVAGLGIFLGIKLRKNKDKKDAGAPGTTAAEQIEQ